MALRLQVNASQGPVSPWAGTGKMRVWSPWYGRSQGARSEKTAVFRDKDELIINKAKTPSTYDATLPLNPKPWVVKYQTTYGVLDE